MRYATVERMEKRRKDGDVNMNMMRGKENFGGNAEGNWNMWLTPGTAFNTNTNAGQ